MFIILQCLTHCDYLHLQKISVRKMGETLYYLNLQVSTLCIGMRNYRRQKEDSVPSTCFCSISQEFALVLVIMDEKA